MIIPKIIQSSQHVAHHYDELDLYYRKFWGEHLHHGLWLSGKESVEEAVLQLVDKIVSHASLKPHERVCDVGCGYGATAARLAETWQAQVLGLTISPAQHQFAQNRFLPKKNLEFLLCDWLKNDLEQASFDLVLSIESSEHMPDKPKFFQEAYRVLRPRGKMAVCAWLASEKPRKWEINYLLEPICREGRLPGMGSAQEYIDWFSEAGFENIHFEDLSKQVKKTWSICAKRVLKSLLLDLDTFSAIFAPMQEKSFFKTLFRLIIAYQTGAMQYGFFCAEKK